MPKVDPEVVDLEQDISNVPNDPITLEQILRLVQREPQTFYNQGKKPRPAIPKRGSQVAVYSYADIRPWLIDTWPGSAYRLPENYEEAKKDFL